jgi:hypothetical protein
MKIGQIFWTVTAIFNDPTARHQLKTEGVPGSLGCNFLLPQSPNQAGPAHQTDELNNLRTV